MEAADDSLEDSADAMAAGNGIKTEGDTRSINVHFLKTCTRTKWFHAQLRSSLHRRRATSTISCRINEKWNQLWISSLVFYLLSPEVCRVPSTNTCFDRQQAVSGFDLTTLQHTQSSKVRTLFAQNFVRHMPFILSHGLCARVTWVFTSWQRNAIDKLGVHSSTTTASGCTRHELLVDGVPCHFLGCRGNVFKPSPAWCARLRACMHACARGFHCRAPFSLRRGLLVVSHERGACASVVATAA